MGEEKAGTPGAQKVGGPPLRPPRALGPDGCEGSLRASTTRILHKHETRGFAGWNLGLAVSSSSLPPTLSHLLFFPTLAGQQLLALKLQTLAAERDLRDQPSGFQNVALTDLEGLPEMNRCAAGASTLVSDWPPCLHFCGGRSSLAKKTRILSFFFPLPHTL